MIFLSIFITLWGIACMFDKSLMFGFSNKHSQVELGGPALIIIGLIMAILS